MFLSHTNLWSLFTFDLRGGGVLLRGRRGRGGAESDREREKEREGERERKKERERERDRQTDREHARERENALLAGRSCCLEGGLLRS